MPRTTPTHLETEMLQAALITLDEHLVTADDLAVRACKLASDVRRDRDQISEYLASIGALPDPSIRPHA